jgi:predicted dehydrogenase
VDRLRVGTLGAARIAPAALIKPARQVPEVTVTAVAARDPDRARRFAARHGIAVVHDSYEALIADPDVDAVYNPLPNSLRAFAAAVLRGEPVITTPEDAVANMRQIDDVYRAAGLPLRGAR